MNKKNKYDFGGYATKNNIKCSDGRVIKQNAFKHQDGQKVPLVWQHLSGDPMNILGHAVLENRADGVYAYAVFNETPSGLQAKGLVEHGDIDSLSIHANKLKQKGDDVIHGMIREVSLVMAGANPGARIDNLTFEHSDGQSDVDDTEAIIHSGSNIDTDEEDDVEEQETDENEEVSHGEGKTIQEVFDTMNEDQKTVVYALVARAVGDENDEMNQSDEGGSNTMKKNIFDQLREAVAEDNTTLTHDQFATIMETAKKTGSLKEAVLTHAVEYGIENIDVLFPDARTLSKDPEWLKREDDWVQTVLGAISKSPFSRIKSVFADMDIDTARAKGYVKATEKKEIYMKAAKRVTTPCTIYVKQKLDRDDIIDVVDFDIVAMVRQQLRTVFDEELVMAAMFGDGREIGSEGKINEENIRPIWTDEDLYTVKETVTNKTDYKALIKQIALSHKNYKGSGSPALYTTPDIHTNMLWVEDENGRRIYESDATLCTALRVSKIVEIPQMEGKTRTTDDNKTRELLAMKVNLRDYNFGADKGGQIASFDDFDIDFNQYKYLLEGRCSGALTKAKSAQVFESETVG